MVSALYTMAMRHFMENIHGALVERTGFTEELDFIINYDIKYRMGREG